MPTVANLLECSAANTCATTTSCCALYQAVAGTVNSPASPTICIPTATAAGGSITLVPATSGTAITAGMTTSGVAYATAACPVVAAGASTLAVSAVAAATAVYMM